MELNHVLPREAASSAPRLIMTGKNDLLLEQHRGIVSYQTDLICVRLREGYLNIHGASLILSAYAKDEICVSGQIHRLEFK